MERVIAELEASSLMPSSRLVSSPPIRASQPVKRKVESIRNARIKLIILLFI
jgi:hypothetical protein